MPHNGTRPPKKESVMENINVIDKNWKSLTKPKKLEIESSEDKSFNCYRRTFGKRIWTNYW